MRDPLIVKCPSCGVEPGEPCPDDHLVDDETVEVGGKRYHVARVEAVGRAAADLEERERADEPTRATSTLPEHSVACPKCFAQPGEPCAGATSLHWQRGRALLDAESAATQTLDADAESKTPEPGADPDGERFVSPEPQTNVVGDRQADDLDPLRLEGGEPPEPGDSKRSAFDLYVERFGEYLGALRMQLVDPPREVVVYEFATTYIVEFTRHDRPPAERQGIALSREGMHSMYILYWLRMMRDPTFERDSRALYEHLDAEQREALEHVLEPAKGDAEQRITDAVGGAFVEAFAKKLSAELLADEPSYYPAPDEGGSGLSLRAAARVVEVARRLLGGAVVERVTVEPSQPDEGERLHFERAGLPSPCYAIAKPHVEGVSVAYVVGAGGRVVVMWRPFEGAASYEIETNLVGRHVADGDAVEYDLDLARFEHGVYSLIVGVTALDGDGRPLTQASDVSLVVDPTLYRDITPEPRETHFEQVSPRPCDCGSADCPDCGSVYPDPQGRTFEQVSPPAPDGVEQAVEQAGDLVTRWLAAPPLHADLRVVLEEPPKLEGFNATFDGQRTVTLGWQRPSRVGRYILATSRGERFDFDGDCDAFAYRTPDDLDVSRDFDIGFNLVAATRLGGRVLATGSTRLVVTYGEEGDYDAPTAEPAPSATVEAAGGVEPTEETVEGVTYDTTGGFDARDAGQ